MAEDIDIEIEQVENLGSSFRTNITTSMTQAAQRAGVRILGSQIAIATRGDILVANAIIDPEDRRPEEQKQIALMFISAPSIPDLCNPGQPPILPDRRPVPQGYYT